MSYADISVQVSKRPNSSEVSTNGTAGIKDAQLLQRAQSTSLFRSFLQRMMYFRAGSEQDINVARVQVVLVNTDLESQIYSKTDETAEGASTVKDVMVLLQYPGQAEQKLPTECVSEANRTSKFCVNLLKLRDPKTTSAYVRTHY